MGYSATGDGSYNSQVVTVEGGGKTLNIIERTPTGEGNEKMAKFVDMNGVTFDTTELDEVMVKVGRKAATHVSERVVAEHKTTNEAIVKVGRKTADEAKKAVNEAADGIKHRSEELHVETRDAIARKIDESNGIIAGWKVFVAFIVAVLAGWGTYLASKDYIVKDVLDAAGNPVGTATYWPYVILLVALAAVAAFFVMAAILSAIGRKSR